MVAGTGRTAAQQRNHFRRQLEWRKFEFDSTRGDVENVAEVLGG